MQAARDFFEPCAKFADFVRCGIKIGGERRIYPRIDRETPRFDRWERKSPGFSLSPFEPPAVPVRGKYDLMYYDAKGRFIDEIPIGKELVELEPIIKGVAYEDGELVPKK